MTTEAPPKLSAKPSEKLESATIRFAGDSGDGMQLTGMQFTDTSALFGNDVSTLPDFPAEIRAPIGTVYGVSGFQIKFSSEDIHTPGDRVNTLVAMNPAALKTNISDLADDGIVIVNSDAFTESNLKLAGYASNPLEDDSLKSYQIFRIPITTMNREAVKDVGLKTKEADRCKNFYALGLLYWLYNRPLDATLNWLQVKFKNKPEIVDANSRALKSGYYYGETAEMFPSHYYVPKAKLPAGKYRKVRGNEALALGLATAGHLSGKQVFYGSYPITPASDILHDLSALRQFNAVTFQAEDEIAAVTSSIGAAYGGSLAVTGTSGPGLALKGEALGLAVMTELPLMVINVQRGGPSTGLPTKTEASDLLQALYGRNGECPMPVIAAKSPGDCYYAAIDAARVMCRHMLPVIVLTDGYLANGAEPWLIPNISEMEPIDVAHPTEPNGENGEFLPYKRDENLSRPWALPGVEGLEHRVGGLEKADITGNVSYDPDNHQHMVNLRQEKVERVANHIPELEVFGDQDGGDLLVLGWGGTHGSIYEAVRRCRANGQSVSHAHLRWISPFPKNTADVLSRFKKVLVPELNMGQLRMVVRSKFFVDAEGLNKVQGRPFMVGEIQAKIQEMLAKS